MSVQLNASGRGFRLGFLTARESCCVVVDEEGEENFADKMGVIIGGELFETLSGQTFVCGCEIDGLFLALTRADQRRCARPITGRAGHSS